MTADRYVVLGLARARAPWFTDVARWATSGLLGIDFVKAVSADEVRARLRSGRRFSALLVDSGLPGVDRDLLELATSHGCVPVVVGDHGRDWTAMGAVATIPASFGRSDLEAALAEHALALRSVDEVPGSVQAPVFETGFRAPTVAVTGSGGVGRSTVAMALAQGLAQQPAHSDTVVLADLCLHAEQGLLHDAGDVIPGVLELVEAHRAGVPRPEEIRSLTFDVVERRYRLLLGLRRHRDWTALRPRSLRAALDGLARSFTMLVADVDADLEGEATTGSADVEERNVMARTAVAMADVIVVVGAPGVKGAHALLRVLRDLLAADVEPERLVPVVNRAPRQRRARAELSTSIRELLEASHPGAGILSPVLLPDRRGLDEAFRDGVPLPDAVVRPLTTAALSRLDALGDHPRADASDAVEPVPVAPGSLGSWSDAEGAAG